MPSTETIAQQIAETVHQLADRKLVDWIRLARVRPLLTNITREEQDAALRFLAFGGEVEIDGTPVIAHLVPDSNRKVLTDEDHAAAYRLGGEDKNLIALEEA